MSFSLKWTKHNCQMSSQASVKLKQNSPIMLSNLSEFFILCHCLNPEKRRLVRLKEYYSTDPLYPLLLDTNNQKIEPFAKLHAEILRLLQINNKLHVIEF